MIHKFYHSIQQKLASRMNENNFRMLKCYDTEIDFFSNDYLGLHRKNIFNPENKYAFGSTGSRLLSGNFEEHEALEKALADLYQKEVLLFNSGYHANIGLLSTVIQKDTLVLYDEMIHASLKDGIRLSLTKDKFSFKHNSLEDLRIKLEKHEGKNIILVVETLYSMNGDFAPIPDLIKLCHEFKAMLILDEAHSTGIFGENGKGLSYTFDDDCILARVHTFGKAFSSIGAFVVCHKIMKEYLINFCRSFIYTTALPPINSAYTLRAFQFITGEKGNKEREKLNENIRYFMTQFGSSIPSPIQPLYLNDQSELMVAAALLNSNGVATKPILYPTVPKGKEMLRIVLHSFNTKNELDFLKSIIN